MVDQSEHHCVNENLMIYDIHVILDTKIHRNNYFSKKYFVDISLFRFCCEI